MSAMEGGCFCGAVRFKVDAPLMGVGVCHCADCQKAGGGAPNYVALALKAGFEITQGEPRRYASPGGSGAEVTRVFCGTCGSPLWSELADAPYNPVKLGAFDDAGGLSPNLHLFTASAPAWHLMHEGVPRFETAPPSPPPAAQA